VPEDGLLVERGPDGATAIAAARFTLAGGETDPVLTLPVASEQGGATAAIAACPTTVRWSPQQAGRWDLAPAFDCEAARIDGVRADDGATWSWQLASLVSPEGVLDVVLVDGVDAPFHVAFEAPTAASLSTTSAPPPPPDVPEPPPPPASQEEEQQPRPGPADGQPTFVPPPVRTETGPPPGGPGGPEPQVAVPDVPPGHAATETEPVAAPAAEPGGPPLLAYALMGLIGVLIVSDLLAGGNAAPGSRPWRAQRATKGGVGRFVRERAEPPAGLW